MQPQHSVLFSYWLNGLSLWGCNLQGGLPATSSTRQFAQELFDRLPGKSGSNGRAPVAAPSQRAQEAAARAIVRQSAQYSLLIDDDEEDAAPELPAPTTAPLPKKRERKLRKDKAGRVQGISALCESARLITHIAYQLQQYALVQCAIKDRTCIASHCRCHCINIYCLHSVPHEEYH